MSETGEIYVPDAAAMIAPLTVDAVLRDLHALNVIVPHEGEIRAYLRGNADVLPVVRAAGARLRARFGPRTSLSLELYRDPEFSARTLTLYAREAEYTDDFYPSLEEVADGLCDDFPYPYGYLRITTDFAPLRDAWRCSSGRSTFKSRDLLAGEPTEAARRSAVSRAYYGAFNHARRYATQYLAYPSLPGADEHTRILTHLRRHRYDKIASRLDVLRLWRNQCDYHDAVPDLTVNAATALTRAAYVVDTLVFY